MKKSIFIFFTISTLLIACGGKKQSDQDESGESITEKTTTPEQADPMENHPGKSLYRQHCGACHQMDGSGVPGMYPPIRETEYVNGDVEYLVNIIVNGLEGPITVKGKEYDNLMPQMAYLSNQEIADILTFVRGSFNNNAGEVTVEEVTKIREGLEK